MTVDELAERARLVVAAIKAVDADRIRDLEAGVEELPCEEWAAVLLAGVLGVPPRDLADLGARGSAGA